MKYHLTLFSILSLFLGGIIGYGLGHFQGKKGSFPEILPIQDVNRGIATFKLMEVNYGNLMGKIEGQKARIIYSSDQILELEKGESFEIPLDKIDLKLFYLKNQIPEEAHFIASKSGKYYYHLLDKRSLGITPKNRIFFKTAEEAEKAGFLPRK